MIRKPIQMIAHGSDTLVLCDDGAMFRLRSIDISTHDKPEQTLDQWRPVPEVPQPSETRR